MSTNCGVPPVTGIGNKCGFPLKVARRPFLMPLVKVDGVTANEWADISEVTEAALTTGIEAGDLFPLPLIDNVEDLQGDPTIYEYASGSKAFIKEGVRDVKFMIPSDYMSTDLLKRLEGWNSREFGWIYFDTAASLVYATDDETKTKVKPMPIEGASWYARLIKHTNEEENMIECAFNEMQDNDDGDLRVVKRSTLGYNGLNTTAIYGLKPLYVSVPTQTTTEIIVTLTTSMGTPVQGFAKTAFTYVPEGQGDEIAASTMVENTTVLGQYTFTGTFTAGAGVLAIDTTKYQKTSDILTIT